MTVKEFECTLDDIIIIIHDELYFIYNEVKEISISIDNKEFKIQRLREFNDFLRRSNLSNNDRIVIRSVSIIDNADLDKSVNVVCKLEREGNIK